MVIRFIVQVTTYCNTPPAYAFLSIYKIVPTPFQIDFSKF
jgi:hypothetical protein